MAMYITSTATQAQNVKICSKKYHNVSKKCHAMTSLDYESDKKMQCRSGYVKVKIIAVPLTDIEFRVKLQTLAG